jgi:NAD(P)-dependent dehydrogenase (short-subunit alcohol dehydrogenase family)
MVQGIAQHADAALLAGRCAIVAMPGLPLGRALARGLRRHGARVVEVNVAPSSCADAEKAMGHAAREAGGADLVVHAAATPAALAARPLEALSGEQWHAAVHRSMLASLYFLQGVYREQHETGGATVLVGPSVALVGVAGLVPLITLAEAQRTLVKSAARQWGRHGMRLNWVGVGAQRYAASLAGAALPPTPELGPPPPALGRVPDAEVEVADVIAWLGSDGARGVTGASFNLDGGDWMVP